MANYLDKTGLGTLWAKIKGLIDGKVNKSTTYDRYAASINSSAGQLSARVQLSVGGSGSASITLTSQDTYGSSIGITASSVNITGVKTPTSNTMAANKKYVDDAVSAVTSTISMSGNVITLTPSSGTASSITLPVYDGSVSGVLT